MSRLSKPYCVWDYFSTRTLRRLIFPLGLDLAIQAIVQPPDRQIRWERLFRPPTVARKGRRYGRPNHLKHTKLKCPIPARLGLTRIEDWGMMHDCVSICLD